MNIKEAEKALLAVAKKEGISIADVRREIEIAISEARKSDDPTAQEFWKSIAGEGVDPTPEEVIVRIVNLINNGQQD